MPRRSGRALPKPASSPPPPQYDSALDNLAFLRKQWRWAAFSQFFYTFAQLLAMSDISIHDIERDLAHQTNLFLPRVMHRLLYTLSYDRKVSLSNWQTALRKQYFKRDPTANPIGPEPESAPVVVEDQEEGLSQGGDDETPFTHNKETKEDTDVSEHAQSSESQNISRSVSVKYSSSPLEDDTTLAQGTKCECSELLAEMSLDWLDLPMLEKLESMHTLVEWQFQNPTRLRTLMKNDDDLAAWRIEPIGYDSKHNAYWFIGVDQLWIQRTPPKPPKQLKRKRGSQKQNEKVNTKSVASPAKRPRLNESTKETRSKDASEPSNSVQTSGRHSRAAKDQAKMKLNAQAKELAEINRQAGLVSSEGTHIRQRSSRPQRSRNTHAVVGTRISVRLRGAHDEEWQSIPQEWLDEGSSTRAPKTGLESDDDSISDLTELSDETPDDPQPSEKVETANEEVDDANAGLKKDSNTHQTLPDDFIEWEVICATLEEWEHIAEQFQSATHYTEKALYKTLTNDIIPFVTEELREIERKRQREDALVHRKRSSRIAIKESEREEARLAARRKQEEVEKQSRAQRMEARQQKEELERIKRENAREQRRREREVREESRKATSSSTPEPKKYNNDIRENYNGFAVQAANSHSAPRLNGDYESKSGSRTPAGEDWELSCEICNRQGINLDDGTPMMSCGYCSRWQHIVCHDRADQIAGRPRRNWDAVDFICQQCRTSQSGGHSGHLPKSSRNHTFPNTPQMYKPSQSGIVTNSDPRTSSSARPNYYGNHTNGVYAAAQMQYPSSSRSQLAPPPMSASRQTISFSHYQPAEHGFPASTQKAYHDAQPTYNHSGYYNNHSGHYNHQQYGSVPTAPYKPQAVLPPWNVTTPAQTPGYPSIPPHHSTLYRQSPGDGRDLHPVNGVQSSVYASQQHYPSSQYRQHPTPYQSPLGRQ